MSQVSSLPSFAVLTNAIQKYEPNAHAAQIHGLLCGYICAFNNDELHCEAIFPNLKENKKIQELLQEVIETSYHQLVEFSFDFSLVLPDENTDINQRAEALGLWCQGFLTGLENGKVPIQNRAPSEVTEVLEDMMDIAEISYGDIAENEEDESAYIELVEYVRLSVLMVFQELHKPAEPDSDSTSAPEDDENPILH